jgi:hypothetical protein
MDTGVSTRSGRGFTARRRRRMTRTTISRVNATTMAATISHDTGLPASTVWAATSGTVTGALGITPDAPASAIVYVRGACGSA